MKKKINIDENLLKTWKVLRRIEDVKELCSITGVSRPVISRALNYGHVYSDKLVSQISSYYIERAKKDKELARKILKELT